MASLDDLMGIQPTPVACAGAAAPAASSAAASTSGAAAAAPQQPQQSAFLSRVFGQLLQSTRLASDLPDPDDHKFNMSASPEFAREAAKTQARLLNLMGLVADAVRHPRESSVAHNARGGSGATPGALPPSRSLSGLADSLDRFHAVVDVADTALEQVDLLLDQHRGVSRTAGGAAGTGAQGTTMVDSTSGGKFQSSHTMLKPQRLFAHLIDNSVARPWIPILTEKPNAQLPLLNYDKLRQEKEREQKSGKAASAIHNAMEDAGSSSSSAFPHPYKQEIESLTFSENPAQLQAGKEQLFSPLASVPCTWVDTPAALDALCEELERSREIAIDLEHHSFRSYQGLTCLMQISNRRADWLVDTLALRASGCLQRLNRAFTDPAIVKVLHGADSDILWLQRDLGLYIVNLFDTGQAARVLDEPKASLAWLLQHYCAVTTEKKFQLADWRIRPLSAEMLLYARMDTHYLLYIYDRLRMQLVTRSKPEQNELSRIRGCAYLLAQVLERSRQISLRTYEKDTPATIELQCTEFAYKVGLATLSADAVALQALFRVRDEVARAEDESPVFVCPNNSLLAIAQMQPTPTTPQQLIACCNRPTPLLIRDHSARVLAALQQAKSGRSGPASASSGSPALRSMANDASAVPELHTPQPHKVSSFTGGLPPLGATPATAASALFAQLSTSTPQQQHMQQWNHGGVAMDDGHYLGSASGHSPVMSQDQLYSSAGWTLASKSFEQGVAAVQQQRGMQQVSGVGGSLGIPLFDLTGSEQPHSSPVQQRSRNNSGAAGGLTALLSPAPKHSTFSMLSTAAETRPDAAHQAAYADARASLLAGPPPTHPPSAPLPVLQQLQFTPLKSVTPPSMDDDAMLRTPRTGEPGTSFTSPSPMSLHIIPSPVTVPAPGADAAAAASSSSGAPSPLPVSMREIYKISNDNRRKKKRAKLTHDGTAAGAAASGEGDDDEPGAAPTSAAPERKKNVSSNSDVGADGKTSAEFLKTIGWGSGVQAGGAGAAAAAGPQQQSNSATTDSAKKRRRSGSSSAPSASLSSSPPAASFVPSASAAAASAVPLHPFDYASASLPPSAPSTHGHFTPYADMGRDERELQKAAGGGAGHSRDPSQKIYKNHTMLKNAGKSVTVRMDDAHQHQGRRGGSSHGIPIPGRNNPQQQQQQQQRR